MIVDCVDFYLVTIGELLLPDAALLDLTEFYETKEGYL